MTYHSPPPARPVAGGVTVRANDVLTTKPIQLNESIETPFRELPVWRTKRFRGPRTCWRSQSCNSTRLDIKWQRKVLPRPFDFIVLGGGFCCGLLELLSIAVCCDQAR